ncbi:hypothetical protein BU15DRAFT_71725 [Melanogaster broomeanus]|nr:hypothetical protein BU15DRAFT_71725 [Melanogaster broomeanus]
MAEDQSIPLTEETELVIELEDNGQEHNALYYFVDHRHRLLFWLHKFEHKKLLGHVKGVQNKSHISTTVVLVAHAPDPNIKQNTASKRNTGLSGVVSRICKVDVLLKGSLIHANAEAITSNTSLAPFDVDELGRMLDLVDRMEEGAKEGQSEVIWVIGLVNHPCLIGKGLNTRFSPIDAHVQQVSAQLAFGISLIRQVGDAKYVNFYGQTSARLNADQSVYADPGDNSGTSRLLFVLDLLLFGSGSSHFRSLKGVWVDHMVNFPRWKGFINKLLAEWNSFTIYSTVMLAVDVSFLAIPALQDISADTSQEQAAIIAIYMSLICIVGSLMVSVLLVGQIRGQEGESAKGAADFMGRMTHSMLGLQALAIMQSVPYALLMWG